MEKVVARAVRAEVIKSTRMKEVVGRVGTFTTNPTILTFAKIYPTISCAADDMNFLLSELKKAYTIIKEMQVGK